MPRQYFSRFWHLAAGHLPAVVLVFSLGALGTGIASGSTLASGTPRPHGPGHATAVASTRGSLPSVTHSYRARLFGVAKVPGTSQVWAVGYRETAALDQRTLAYRWNGSQWVQVATPSPGMDAELTAITATSASDAWAVGFSWVSTKVHVPLILHWNGTAWKVVRSYLQHGSLRGVAATSRTNAWAVGYEATSVGDRTLILRWNGTAWKHVTSPGLGYTLNAVAATSKSNAWAVGDNGSRTFIAHWNGSAWRKVSSPSPGYSELQGVAAVGGSAWAVGHFASPNSWSESQALILRWNGRSWVRASVGTAGSFSELHAVAASSATNVWAVGDTQASSGWRVSLVYRWNGSSWRLIASPASYYSSNLRFAAVTCNSATNVSVVGYTDGNYDPNFYAYLARWNGSRWSAWIS